MVKNPAETWWSLGHIKHNDEPGVKALENPGNRQHTKSVQPGQHPNPVKQ